MVSRRNSTCGVLKMKNIYELIIVVVAIFIAALLLGSVNKEVARRNQCQANLKELFRAEQQYEATYGSLPPLYIAKRPAWVFWHSYIAPFVKDTRTFACPSDPRMSYLYEKSSPLFRGIVTLSSCYGMNRFMIPAGAKKIKAPEFKLKYLSKPAEIVFIMDSVRPFVTPDLLWADKRNFRHEGKGNYLFCDGSVKWLDKKYFGQFEGKKFKTNFTYWHWR